MSLSFTIQCSCLFASLALANTEKAIFIAPAAIALPDAAPGLDALNLATISSAKTTLRTALSVVFPTQDRPHGLDAWYLLQALDEHQRYEVRVCWAAIVCHLLPFSHSSSPLVSSRLSKSGSNDLFSHPKLPSADLEKQPTQFWLDVYNITHVFDTPDLIQSLAAYSELRQTLSSTAAEDHQQAESSTTTLFLRVQAAADFFSTNKTLMTHPPPVDVDIILDPYLANVFPASLLPTAAYIVVLAVIAWFVSGKIWTYLATSSSTKVHAE